MAQHNYYDLLGLSLTATAEEIRSAYRKLARKYHPDTAGTEASEQMLALINEAYAVLSDPEQRKVYDQKADFPSKLREKLREYERQQKSASNRPEKSKAQSAETGADLRGPRVYRCSVNQLEALRGAQREVVIEHAGQTERLNVHIPAGVKNGLLLPVRSDLLGKKIRVEVDVRPHPFVALQGDDLLLRIPVSAAEIKSGLELQIPTLEGAVKVKIPAAIEAGKKLRLTGLGLKTLNNERMRGDLLVEPLLTESGAEKLRAEFPPTLKPGKT